MFVDIPAWFTDLIAATAVIATAIQIIYWVFIFLRVAFVKNSTVSAVAPANTALSVIICARNEARNLEKYLPLILNQQYSGPFEVIVVNDDSSDSTALVLEALQRAHAHLKIVHIEQKMHAGKKQALTTGVQAAQYEWIVVTDADCFPSSPFWLQHLAETATPSEKEIVLGYGPVVPRPGLLNSWIRYETFYTALQYMALALLKRPYMGVGRNLVWKKSLFEKSNGFKGHEDLASGDDDLFISAVATGTNTAVCLHSQSFMFSEGKETWSQYVRQKSRHFTTGNRYPLIIKILLITNVLSHTLHYSCMCLLLILNFGMVFVCKLCLMRMLVVLLVTAFTLRKMREIRLLPLIPVFDACLPVYYFMFARIILFTNNKSNLERSWT